MFTREIPIIGLDGLKKLKDARVCLFGLGGVGGYVAETLVRAGIGHLSIVDYDTISLTNLNRQIIALHSTIGQKKTEALKSRLLDINPDLDVITYDIFVNPETIEKIPFSFDYVVDAVDNITAKLAIISKAKASNSKVIAAMGTGNKIDPTKFKICDINQTKVCPLAKVMRYELKKRGITDVPVLYSEEEPIKSNLTNEDGKVIPASISFTPSIAGILIARKVILDIIA